MMIDIFSKKTSLPVRQFLGSVAVGALTFAYAAVYWLGDSNLQQARMLVSLQFHKPWVYRQLVPILARMLATVGLRIDLALVLVVTVAGIGFYLALRSLARMFYGLDNKGEILIILLVGLGTILFGYLRISFDLMTAWLFTLAFLYIARQEPKKLTVVILFSSLNRETTCLLLVFIGILILYFNWINLFRYKSPINLRLLLILTAIFGLVQIGVRFVFRDNAGLNGWIEPGQNLRDFIENPARTLLHATVTLVLLWIACRDWTLKPFYFRLAFWVLAPFLVLIYFVFGQSFEVRVFWEIYPVLSMLMLPTLHDWLLAVLPGL